MRKFFVFTSMLLLLALNSTARADEAVRSAQAILKTAGYYTGEATGELTPDTKAALRRYQIRNELEPTGELTPETAAALNQEGKPEEAAPAPTAPVPPPPAAIPTPNSQPAPPPPAAVRPPGEPSPDYAVLYARTPYLNAPLEVQRETLRKADAAKLVRTDDTIPCYRYEKVTKFAGLADAPLQLAMLTCASERTKS